MIAHSATLASARGAKVAVSRPSAAPTVGTIPKNGANRNFQTAPTATGASTNGARKATTKNVLPRLASPTRRASDNPIPVWSTTAAPVNSDGVQEAPVEDGVSEDRPGEVIEPDEVREIKALRVVHAQHDPVDQRVEEEDGQDRQGRPEEQQVDAAFARRARTSDRANSRAGREADVRRARACDLDPDTHEPVLTGRTIRDNVVDNEAWAAPNAAERPLHEWIRDRRRGAASWSQSIRTDGPWHRARDRRDVLKLGVLLAAGGALAPLLAACGAATEARRASAGPQACPALSRSSSAKVIPPPNQP